jgi:hypothetical protein
MPDDAPNVAVVDAGAQPAAAAPTPPATGKLVTEQYPDLVRRLIDASVEETDKPDKPKEEKPREAPKTAEPAKAEVKAEPKADEKPITVRRQKVVRPALPVIEPPKPAVAEVAAKPDPKWEEALKENEREMLADAREAAEIVPGKYKELPTKVEAFLKKHSEIVNREGFDESAPDYKAWVEANMPKLSRKEIREIETVRVTREVEGKQEAKFADLKYEMYRKQKEPEIEQHGQALYNNLVAVAMPDELAEAVKKDGAVKASAAMKLEVEAIGDVCARTADQIKEMVRLTEKDPATGRPLATEATDPSDPKYAIHERLRKVMDEACSRFQKEAAADQQLVNGRWFVTREEWGRIRPESRGQYWTFSNAQLIEYMKSQVKPQVEAEIALRRKKLEGYGFTRAQAAAAVKQEPAPKPEPAGNAAPRGAPIPGAGDNGTKPDIDPRAAKVMAAWAQA